MTKRRATANTSAKTATGSTTKTLRISEADIEQTCTEILEWDGWRAFKTEYNFSEKKQRAFGEEGMPDHLYIRYGCRSRARAGGPETSTDKEVWAMCDVMWIEWKALNGEASVTQKEWHAYERQRGALVLCAGIDFPPTIEGFREFYAASGLQRRR